MLINNKLHNTFIPIIDIVAALLNEVEELGKRMDDGTSRGYLDLSLDAWTVVVEVSSDEWTTDVV